MPYMTCSLAFAVGLVVSAGHGSSARTYEMADAISGMSDPGRSNIDETSIVVVYSIRWSYGRAEDLKSSLTHRSPETLAEPGQALALREGTYPTSADWRHSEAQW
jgi:hypothetical protein